LRHDNVQLPDVFFSHLVSVWLQSRNRDSPCHIGQATRAQEFPGACRLLTRLMLSPPFVCRESQSRLVVSLWFPCSPQ
jgi:hypothetical protein